MEKEIFESIAQLKHKYLEDGPFVYELYAVMLHKGGAYGGHYSAYIKDLEGDTEDSWYHFNDSLVSDISVTELADAFGGKANFANAYMLMYRLYEPIQKSSLDEIPEEVKADVIENL